ncbi:MAG: hypothetical protein V1872_13380 [bacterium]
MKKKSKLIKRIISISILFMVILIANKSQSDNREEHNFSKLNIGDILKEFEQDPRDSQVIIKKYKTILKLGINRTELNEILYHLFSVQSSPTIIVKILDIIVKVKIANLPVEPIFNKIREGLAKGMSSSLIANAISWKAKTLNDAKDVLEEAIFKGYSPFEQEQTIIMINDFLSLDISKRHILEIMTTYKTQRNLYELKNLLIIEVG